MAIFTKDQFRSAVSSLSERYYFPNVLNEARSYSEDYFPVTFTS